MENFQLSSFLTIQGIGAASGIVYHKQSLFLISDSSSFLYEYSLTQNNLTKIALQQDAQQTIIKKQKPDFEALTLKNGQLHLFGSGSTIHRNTSIVYTIASQEIERLDLAPLYQHIKDTFSITDDELNIEGALFKDNDLLLFQRGNGAQSKNGILKIPHNQATKISFHPITLPKIKQVETSFTDAILIDKTIYFLAAAEDSSSTYEDGEILGSILGTINLETLTLEKHLQISNQHKFEGLTLYAQTSHEIEFLLCEDNDTEVLSSTIYQLKIT